MAVLLVGYNPSIQMNIYFYYICEGIKGNRGDRASFLRRDVEYNGCVDRTNQKPCGNLTHALSYKKY